MAVKFAEQIPVIKETLRRFPAGANRAELSAALPEPPDDRTLQGWLQTLVGTGSIRREGEDSDARFFAIAAEASEPSSQLSSLNSQLAGPAPAIDPDFASMFDLGLVLIVTMALPREDTRTSLQRQAVEFKKAGPAMKAYIDYAFARLDKFTVAEAETYGFTAQQFAKWEQVYRHGLSTPKTTVTPPTTSAPDGDDSDFPKMFERALPRILDQRRDRADTGSWLRGDAVSDGKRGPAVAAYVKFALARLDALTQADADVYGLTPAEFKAWKDAYAPQNPANADAASASRSDPTKRDEGVAAPGRAPTALGASDQAANGVAALPRASNTDDPDPFTAEGLLKAMQHGRSDAYKKYAFQLIKSLLTPWRIAICIGFAVALKYSLRELLPFSSAAWLIVFPLSGLAWVWFRWLDETEENRLNGKEAAIILVAGGVVSVFVANGVLGLIGMLQYAAR